jgi:hypothetical protein
MELYVPNAQLKGVTEMLTKEGVSFEVTNKTSTLALAGKEAYEVTMIKAELLETEVPPLYESPPRTLRAFRLPSGKIILLTDVDGNFDRLVEPPPGWER